MPATSRFRAKIFVGLLAAAGVAACSLTGSDVDHYNSGNGEPKEPTATSGGAAPGANKADGAPAEGGAP